MKSWPFIQFIKSFIRLQRGQFTNKETGEIFSSLILTAKDGSHVFLGFSSNMGELTNQELKSQKDDLQVVQLESGSYKLCRKGESSWEDIDLGL